MQHPSAGAIALGVIPFFGMCFSVPLWDRVYPLVFGLPFNLFWLVAWIIVSSGCLAGAHRIEERKHKKGSKSAA